MTAAETLSKTLGLRDRDFPASSCPASDGVSPPVPWWQAATLGKTGEAHAHRSPASRRRAVERAGGDSGRWKKINSPLDARRELY